MGGGRGLGGGGRLLTFSVVRMGTYSRWMLIQGWALIRINTVQVKYMSPQMSFRREANGGIASCPLFS